MQYLNNISAERIRELLEYDPKTGEFTWRVTRNNRVKIGQRAGCKNGCGYITIHSDGVRYKAHRLAWLHVYGEWPEGDLDHQNMDRSDNRIDNLRPATNSQNQANSCLRVNNSSGFRGVWLMRDHKRAKPWVAKIRKDGKRIHLGYFATPEEGHAAFTAAARRLFGEFARVS